MKKIIQTLILCLLSNSTLYSSDIAQITQKKAIFVDLGGILFDKNDFEIFVNEIGIGNMLNYMWHRKSIRGLSTALRAKLFEILDVCMPWPQNNTVIRPCDESGKQLPYLMSCWMTGTMSCESIKNRVLLYIEQHSSLFSCQAEQDIIHNIANMMFSPERFAKYQQVNPVTVMLLKLWKKMGYELYVLSNWDAQSFELLKEIHSDIFDLFDGQVVSGKIGLAKPDIAIYIHALQKYNLNSQQVYFIDDQLHNITAAQKIGITGLYCPTKQHILKLLQHNKEKRAVYNTALLYA